MATPSAARGAWTSRTGFIFAAAGSAIGLGNIWRFPYTAGESGGGAFVLIYLLCVVLIGIPVLFAELAIGRSTEKNPVGAFKKIVPGSMWPVLGGLGIATGFGILAFYSVIAGWTLSYLFKAVTGGFGQAMTADESAALFTQLTGDPVWAIILAGVFILLTIFVVQGGVSGGIERTTKILMPVLLVILVILAIRSVTLPNGMAGVEYLFKPDFSKVNIQVFMQALGQALFSLSLGMGAMITYGSYLPKSENMPVAGVSVAFFDTIIALLAGLIIFPAIFSVGGETSGGPGLVFVVLPSIFNSLPAGNLFAVAFYFLLAIAALTSTISLLEVCVSYFVDEKEWSRQKAAWLLGGICFAIAIPSALSQGGSEFFTSFVGGLDFLSIQNIIWGNFSLSIGALLLCIFVAWKWGVPKAIESLEESGDSLPAKGLWSFLIRFVCPVAVGVILIFIIVTQQYF
ncbi:MAG: sodium-dependent transporter [Rhodothermales bacterium]|nr:sodium-dependent transporter [Rhodothermales bacterium]